MKRRVRAGVIGAGSFAVASHIPNLLSHPEVELVAVARKGPQLGVVAERFHVPVASEEYEAVLEQDLDLCVVASPTAFHYEHAKAALLQGCHVLCEKPFVLSPDHARELDAIAESAGVSLAIAFGWNYKSQIIRAKDFITQQDLGTLESAQVVMSSATRVLLLGTGAYPDAAEAIVPESRTWTEPKLSGGGYAQAQLSHAFGALFYLTDDKPVGGFAIRGGPVDAPVELHAGITMQLASGAVATVAGSSAVERINNDQPQLFIRLTYQRGQVEVDLGRDGLVLFRDGDQSDGRVHVEKGAGAYDCVGPIDFIVEAASGVHPLVNRSSGAVGARTVEALDVAYRSLESKQWETAK